MQGDSGFRIPHKLSFLYIARGSAGEVRSMTCLLEKIAPFRNLESGIRNLKQQTETVSRQLGAWIQSLLISGMKGQRYVTNKVRTIDQKKVERDEFLKKLERIRTGSEAANSNPETAAGRSHES